MTTPRLAMISCSLLITGVFAVSGQVDQQNDPGGQYCEVVLRVDGMI